MRQGKHALPAAVVVACVAALAVAAAAPARTEASSPIKAAWIYVGPHNDGGWSQAHDRGRLAVQRRSARTSSRPTRRTSRKGRRPRRSSATGCQKTAPVFQGPLPP